MVISPTRAASCSSTHTSNNLPLSKSRQLVIIQYSGFLLLPVRKEKGARAKIKCDIYGKNGADQLFFLSVGAK